MTERQIDLLVTFAHRIMLFLVIGAIYYSLIPVFKDIHEIALSLNNIAGQLSK